MIAKALDLSDYMVLLDERMDLPSEEEVQVVSPGEIADGFRGMLRGDRALLPLWQTVLAGREEECSFVDPDNVQWEEVPALFVGQDVERFVLCVASGTSMSPRISQGDRIVVRMDSAPPRNTLVIAENPERRRYVKVLRERQRLELHSVNEKFAPIEDTTDWTLIGSVVCVIKAYESGANIEWDFGKPLRG
jgi:hypothetical protein